LAKPLGDFENKARLLSDDEKELIGVLKSFHDTIQDQGQRLVALEEDVVALRNAVGAVILVNRKKDD
jgi:hypothetical protein